MFNKSTLKLALVLCFPLAIVACSSKTDQAKAPPTKPYNVIVLEKTSTTLFAEYPARLEGVLDIDIRPKIDGYIEKVFVDEGQVVRKGQLLFTINNPQFGQDVNNSQAAIASAEAAVAAAQLQVRKTKPLVDQDIISKYDLESAQLTLRARQADLARARAVYNNSKISQAYTSITSPVNGLVGSIPFRVGSYISASTATPLTTVSDVSSVYAYFSMNEKQQLDFFTNTPGANVQQKLKSLPKVNLILSNSEEYPEKGTLQSISGQVNSQTGAFNVRASFPNPGGLLRSGSSAIVSIPNYVNNAIIIPQKATAELQDKRLAYIVGDSSKVKAVPIKVRAVPGGKFFVVDEGLKIGDKLIVEGIGLLTEGTIIKPTLISSDSAYSALEIKK